MPRRRLYGFDEHQQPVFLPRDVSDQLFVLHRLRTKGHEPVARNALRQARSEVGRPLTVSEENQILFEIDID